MNHILERRKVVLDYFLARFWISEIHTPNSALTKMHTSQGTAFKFFGNSPRPRLPSASANFRCTIVGGKFNFTKCPPRCKPHHQRHQQQLANRALEHRPVPLAASLPRGGRVAWNGATSSECLFPAGKVINQLVKREPLNPIIAIRMTFSANW